MSALPPLDAAAQHRLLMRMLGVDSTSGHEAALTRLLHAELSALGFTVALQHVAPSRDNLLVDAPGCDVLLCTHLDTVPPWFAPSALADAIAGRGACDAKGIVVAMIAAATRLRAAGEPAVGMLFVVGEEVDGAGAQVANAAVRAGWVIVGEPTENRLVAAHKGVVKFRLHARGRAAHSAYPDQGHSALHDLIAACARLLQGDFGRDTLLGQATLNIGRLEGGVAANVLADHAVADGLLRSVRAATADVATLRGLVGEAAELTVVSAKDPSRMWTVPGLATDVVSFSTDIPYLQAVGRPLLYGPGSIRVAHSASEAITHASLARAVDDYVRIVRELRAGMAQPPR